MMAKKKPEMEKKKSQNKEKEVVSFSESVDSKVQSILRSRAQELAEEPEEELRIEDQIEILEFVLTGEHYGVESIYAKEVYPMKELTPIPGLPSFVIGIINIRGQILSILDIRRFFELPTQESLGDLNRVIVVHTPEMELGLLADRIVGVHFLPKKKIQPPLPTLTGIRSEFLLGVTSERLILLDIQKMLKDPRLIVNQEVE